MKVAFYGKLADLLGREAEVDVDGPCTIRELRNLLAEQHPEAAAALANERARACVGDAIVPDSRLVRPSEAVEFLAPVSGG